MAHRLASIMPRGMAAQTFIHPRKVGRHAGLLRVRHLNTAQRVAGAHLGLSQIVLIVGAADGTLI